MVEPELPDSVTAAALDTDVRRDLRGLQKETAESVARHLVAAGLLVDEDPARALEHARYARRRAARIAVVRETSGIVAYHAGEWNEALGEFRAARRMGGGSGHVPVMADIERALGRPERALELARGPEARGLEPAARIELLIVAAGARRDLGELEAAVVGLQVAELDPARREPWSARLFYAYADNLLAVDRRAEAVQWFVHAYDADTGDETDAADRIADLTGDAPPGADTGDDDFVVALDVEDTDAAQPATEERPAPSADGPDTRTGGPVESREPSGPARADDRPVDELSVGGDSDDRTPDDRTPEDRTPEDHASVNQLVDEASDGDVSDERILNDQVPGDQVPGDQVPGDQRASTAADEDGPVSAGAASGATAVASGSASVDPAPVDDGAPSTGRVDSVTDGVSAPTDDGSTDHVAGRGPVGDMDSATGSVTDGVTPDGVTPDGAASERVAGTEAVPADPATVDGPTTDHDRYVPDPTDGVDAVEQGSTDPDDTRADPPSQTDAHDGVDPAGPR